MKMLTGLLPATEGRAELFGRPWRPATWRPAARRLHVAGVLALRRADGPRELVLHARLYHLPPTRSGRGSRELLERFGLAAVADARPTACRWASASGCRWPWLLHEPEILILDEPTSGVDPVARDSFWSSHRSLAAQGVTIFVSTHFMNEAERCDRISLMHAGRVLAAARPRKSAARGAATLEEAFIAYLRRRPAAQEAARRARPRVRTAQPTPADHPAWRASASAGSGPMPGARLWSSGAIRSASPSPCSAPSC